MIVYVNNETTKVGHQNDNQATVIAFPISDILQEFGSTGEWTALIRRPTETDVYMIPWNQITTDAQWLYWTVSATDVEFSGYGELQIQYKVGEVVKMTRKYDIAICSSLVSTEDAPSYLETWLDLIQEKIDEDLSDYYTKEEVDELIGEAGTLKPGYAPDTTRTEESTAGAKGWYMSEWLDIGGLRHLEVVNADGSVPDLYETFAVGDILSAKAGFSANYALKVEELGEETYPEKCAIRISFTDNYLMLAQGAPFAPEDHLYPTPIEPGIGYVWNPEKPGIGSVEIGIGAMSIGWGNKSNERGALAIGADNEVDGRYAFATGQNNKVAYGSAALGHNNTVYGYDSIAVGSYNTTRNWRGAAFGQANSMNAVNGFASGHGNNATKDAHDGINIRGTYAVNQSADTFIDVVGNGTDADHRSNALAVGASTGSLRIKGDIFVNCAANSSGGTNLRTAIEGKEDKGTYTLLEETTINADTEEDIWIYLSQYCRSVLVWISFPRTVTENFRVYANEAVNQNGGQIAVTSGGTGVCNAKIKFDATHGILESEWAKQEGLGGYVTKTTYAGYANEPVLTNAIESIIIRNISNGIIRQGTKIKIYGY